MSTLLERLGPEGMLAVAVALCFLVTGVIKLLPRRSVGRRAVNAEPAWLAVFRRLRGVLELLGGLAVLAGAAITVVRLKAPFPAFEIGIALSSLAAWTVIDAVRPRVRPVALVLALAGFALAVFYAGFRE